MAALFFDIDDTLIGGLTAEIPESAKKALREAKEQGHQLFINTGRTICSIPAVIKNMEFDGLLCGCGTYLFYENEVLMESHIPYEKGRRYIDAMEDCKMEGFLEGTEDIYFSERVSRFEPIESTRRYMEAMGLGREKSIEKKNFQYDKILVLTDERCEKDLFFSCIKEEMEIIDRGRGMYECIQKGYDKATAIEYMRRHLGISREDVYVFGDSSNDLAMFEYAKHSVAMGKHDPALDPYTEYVTDTVENDGIYKAMVHYGLISG